MNHEVKLKVLLGVVLLSVCFLLKSQNQQIADSVYLLYKKHNIEDSLRLSLLRSLAINSPNQDSVFKFSNKLLHLSKKLSATSYEGYANLLLGVNYRFRGNLEKSLEYLIESARIAERGDMPGLLGEAYTEISASYTSNGDVRNALRYSNMAIDIFRETDKKQELAISLMNVGYVYYTIDNLDTALLYFNEAEPYFEEMGFNLGAAYTIGNRALVYWKRGDLEKAKNGLSKALEMLEPYGDLYGMSDFYVQLGSVFLDEGNIQEAIDNTSIGLEMALTEDLKEQARDASLTLYQLYKGEKEYRKALEYQTQYIALKDSIQDQETTQQLADIRTAYEVGQKQIEVDLANQQKENRQILAIALGVIAILAAGFFVNFYLAYQKRKKFSQKLEALNATKDKFFSIVSHDLRGPVSAFNGISTLIKGYLEQKAYDELEEVSEEISKSSNSLSELLDNLLSWAVQQQGNVPYNPVPVDVNEIVNTTVQIFETTAKAKQIAIENKIGRPLYINSDKDTTMTIFRNLVGNAFKFTSQGGKVWIEAETKDDQVHVMVRDTGIGMSQKQVDKLFQMRENRSYGTDGETGLGLGLQLVQEFVTMNKGTITVESIEGEGSTFIVSLTAPDMKEILKEL